MRVNHLSTVAVLLLTGFAMNALALQETNDGNFDVNATVGASCTVAGTIMDFGTYDPLDADPVDAQSTVSVTCTGAGTNAYVVALNAGVNASGDYATMNMVAPGGTAFGYINYAIYTASNYVSQWGDGDVGTASQAFTGSHAFIAYGRAPGAQIGNVGANGTYTDTVTATITY